MRTLLCLLFCFAASTFVRAEDKTSDQQAAEGLKTSLVHVGDPAPAFSGTDLAGKAWDLSAHKGRLVLVNFFATWCPPCIEELPHLEKDIFAEFSKAGLVLVSVGRGHTAQQLQPFVRKMKLSFTVLPDADKAIYGKFAKQYIPRTYLIGKDGRILLALTGYDEAEFKDLIAKIRAELK